MSVIMGASKKLPRVTRSSLGAEVQSATMAVEDQEWLRLMWVEMSTGEVNLKNANPAIASVTAAVVTDCKGLYDSINRNSSSGLGVADRRSAIEALGLRQSLAVTKTELRWVHSEAMPADGLTEGSTAAHQVTMDFLTRGYWRLVRDDTFTAARKRKAAGREDILDDGIVRKPFLPTYNDDDEDLIAAVMPVGPDYFNVDRGPLSMRVTPRQRRD